MTIEISLEGQRALITGASQGIGKGIAVVLARAGASVALCARREKELTEVAAKIRADGGRAIPVPADLTDRSAAEGVVSDTVDALGGLDILVNNAGASERVRPHEVTDEDIDLATEPKFRAGVRYQHRGPFGRRGRLEERHGRHRELFRHQLYQKPLGQRRPVGGARERRFSGHYHHTPRRPERPPNGRNGGDHF